MKKQKQFNVIECFGSPYEIGLQMGVECRDNIVKALQMTIGGLSWVNNVGKPDIIANAMKFFPRVKDFNPELIDQLRGMAEGAKISFEEAITFQCGYDLGGYYNQLSSMCTSFAVTGEATENGQTILGQTIDWFPGCPMDLVRTVHLDGLRQLKLVLWGVAEYTLNSTGFGMCANGTWGAVEKYMFNTPMGFYLHKAMRQNTLEDAMEILRANARGLGYFHLASSEKKMVGIESIQDDFEMILPTNGILVHSNNYLTERFKSSDMASIIIPDSPDRVERIRALINDHYGYITPELMMMLMTDHDKYPCSICRHVDPSKPPEAASETLAAYVMIPEDGVIYIARGNPCQYSFGKYSL